MYYKIVLIDYTYKKMIKFDEDWLVGIIEETKTKLIVIPLKKLKTKQENELEMNYKKQDLLKKFNQKG